MPSACRASQTWPVVSVKGILSLAEQPARHASAVPGVSLAGSALPVTGSAPVRTLNPPLHAETRVDVASTHVYVASRSSPAAVSDAVAALTTVPQIVQVSLVS